MNYVEAAFIGNELAEKCRIKLLRKHKQPKPRMFKDFSIYKEGYCIFCEDYRSYRSNVQRCIIFFIKSRQLDSVEKENNLIIF